MPTPVLEACNITKRYGGLTALRNVSLTVRAGQVHGLIGANGAGKSTLVKIMAGAERQDSGQLRLSGEDVSWAGPHKAREAGITVIHQELALVPTFSALRCLGLGIREFSARGFVNERRLKKVAQPVVDRLGARFSLDTRVSELTIAERWLIAIGRALMTDVRLIAMDEPTASLSEEECSRLFAITRDLANDGVAILYISHRLDEIVELCDRVTVLRDGMEVETLERDRGLTTRALTDAILGHAREHEGLSPDPAPARQFGRAILEVRGLTREPHVRDVSFDIAAGEIVGLGGLVGSGRTEVARLVFGADQPQSGEMRLLGKAYSPRGPHHAIQRRVALVPEERRSLGLVMSKSVMFNLMLVNVVSSRSRRSGNALRRLSSARALAEDVATRLDIRGGSLRDPVIRLSGGNQQKVVLGKWLLGGFDLLILDEPTRGVDVGARDEIYNLVRTLASNGIAVIMISSELQEMTLCDRVLVMFETRIVAELKGHEISEQAILAKCFQN